MTTKIATAEDIATELRTLLSYVEGGETPSRGKITMALSKLLERTAGSGFSPERERLQLDFPWNAGSPDLAQLERQSDLVNRYIIRMRKLAHGDRALDQHYHAMEEVASAMLAVKVRLEKANNLLYQR